MGVFGLTGWRASLKSDQAFVNHACVELDSTASALEKAFETDEDIKYNNHIMFNPAIQRCASLFYMLSNSTRYLVIGVELMVDCNSFHDAADDDF